MSFRRGYREKLRLLVQAGVKSNKDGVTLLNSISGKNRRRRKL